MRVTFTINDHDQDGDVSDVGFFFHFGETRIKVAKNLAELDSLVENIIHCKEEIHQNLASI